jgi:hypothetical protein
MDRNGGEKNGQGRDGGEGSWDQNRLSPKEESK